MLFVLIDTFCPIRNRCVRNTIKTRHVRLEINNWGAVKGVYVINYDYTIIYGFYFAHGQSDRIWSKWRTCGKNSCEGVINGLKVWDS